MTQQPSLRSLAAVLLAVVALGAASCGSDDAASERRSGERPESTTDGSAADSDSAAYCERVTELTDADLGPDPDPTAVIELLESLAPLAPTELADSFDVLAGAVADLGTLDEEDPDDVERLFEIALAPEVVEASDAITGYTEDECGVDLEGEVEDRVDGDPDTDDSAPDLDDPEGDGVDEVELDDVAAVADASSAPWAAKIAGTMVSGGQVQVVAMETEPFTADEALAACEALLAGLVTEHPTVAVTVLNAEVEMAAAPSGGSCAAA